MGSSGKPRTIIAGLSGGGGMLAGDSDKKAMEAGEDITEGSRDVKFGGDLATFYAFPQ
jgi:hypothetical protein